MNGWRTGNAPGQLVAGATGEGVTQRVVTDDHVAVLRAILVGNFADYERLAQHVERTNAWEGFNYLVTAAFYEAVYRSFGDRFTIPEVISFIASRRAELNDPEADFDPRIAERLILAALGNGSVEGIDESAKGHAQVSLLVAMVAHENLDDASVDDFLIEARKVANNTSTRS